VRTPNQRWQIIERLFEILPQAEFQFTRRQLANILAEIGRVTMSKQSTDDPVNQRLLAYLRDDEWRFAAELRKSVLRSLGNHGAKTLIHPLLEMLIQMAPPQNSGEYKEFEEFQELKKTIASLAQPDAVIFWQLFNLACDPKTETELAKDAAYLLASTGTVQVAKTLLAKTKDANLKEEVRPSFAFSTAMLGDKHIVEELFAFSIQSKNNPFMFFAPVSALMERHYHGAVSTLLPLLSKKDLYGGVRNDIARAFLYLGNQSTARALIPLVTDRSLLSEVRLTCARVFAILGGYDQRVEVLNLISNRAEDGQVRCELVLGLAETGDGELRTPLYNLYLEEPVSMVREALVIALGVLGEPAILKELETIWETDRVLSSGLYQEVTDVLARLLELLACENVLRSTNISAYRRADFARSLGRTNRGEEFLSLLITLTGNFVVQEQVREACAMAIGELAETRADAEQLLGLLRAYKRHPTYSYRNSAPVDVLFRALWRVSRRAGLLVLPSLAPDTDPYAYRLVERGAPLP
jgi:HEAT repeat protein